MKRSFAIVLILSVLVCALCGCRFAAENLGAVLNSTLSDSDLLDDSVPEGLSEVSKDALELSSPHYEIKTLSQGYESLPSEDMKECYNRIEESVYSISSEKDGDCYKTQKVTLDNVTLSEAQLRVIIAAYFGDHPQVFWLDNNFRYASNEDRTVLQFTSFLTASEVEKEAKKLRDIAAEIIGGLESGLSEYERELYVHDALIERCEYDDSVDSIDDSFRAFTSLGALSDCYAVCEGYSKAFQYLLSYAGIESYCITGTGENELHMWNVVKIDDSWYYVDTTWDEDDYSGVSYNYFNLSETQLEYSHTITDVFSDLSDEKICGDEDTLPCNFNLTEFPCDNESMSYYINSGVCIDNIGNRGKNKLSQEIVDSAYDTDSNDFAIFLYIDTDYLDYDYAVNNLFYGGEYLIFHAVDDANYRMFKTVDRDSISIKKIPELSAVNVYLTCE